MVALAAIPTAALAYVAPDGWENYPSAQLEYRMLYTEQWRRLPKYSRKGVTYRLNAKTHRAIVTRVSVDGAVIPNRFKVSGVTYYPDIVDESAISAKCKTLTIHGRVSMLDYCALTWCTVRCTDRQTYNSLKSWCGTWAKKHIKHVKCKDCVKHAKDHWHTHGSSVL
jgi:hypothetical protein